jgi:D-serine deaminase-like pyridoxal phosphate-dependent protein
VAVNDAHMSHVAAQRLNDALGPRLDLLSTPALVIDRDAARHNIAAVLARVGSASRWRPHIKTIKQAPLVEDLLRAGVHRLKCATPLEAKLALDCAARLEVELDLLVAYPLARPGIEAVLELARRMPANCSLSLLADDPQHLRELDAQVPAESKRIGVFLDVDLGMGRTGQDPQTWLAALAAISKLERIELRGLHGYDGHHRFPNENRARAHAGYDALISLAIEILDAPSPRKFGLELVTSGTHSYAHALAHPGLSAGGVDGRWEHTISPGTVVLNDRRSSDAASDLGLRQAAFVATRVVSCGRARVTLDAGSKGLAPDTSPDSFFALGHPTLQGQRRSEEHLVCETAAMGSPPPRRGDLLWVVPEHVCTTVNMYRQAIHISDGGPLETVDIAAAARLPWGLPEGGHE